MFIGYHLIYFAIGFLLYICSFYYHQLVFIIYFAYLYFIFKRLDYRYVLMILLLSFSIHLKQEIPFHYQTHIKGVITKISDKYDYVKVNHHTIKLYNDYDFQFNDYVDINVEYLDMNVNTNDNGFHEELYLKGQNIFVKAKLKNVIGVKNRKTLFHIIESRLSDSQSVNSYQRLLLLGEKSEGIEGEYQTLSDLSLVHLFALSGLHVTILYSLVSSVIGIFVSKKLSKLITFSIIGLYIFSIPFSISLTRAFLSMVLYELLKKYLNKLDILALLVIVSLLYNPYYIYNISFIFSYFIYFVVLITKDIQYSFFYIYLSTLPIVLSLNYEFSILSVLFADILNPFIEVFYILNCLSIVLPFIEVLLTICANCLNHIITFLDFVSLRIIVGKPNISFILFYYIVYFTVLMHKEKNKSAITPLCVMIALILSFSFYNQHKLYGQVTMIDVGQGDCTLIRLPWNKGNILIDTGGSQDYDVATSTIIPYLKSVGITHLDYVYISHDDYDHCGALDSLVEHYDVRQVIDTFEEIRMIDNAQFKMINHILYDDSNDNSLIIHVKLEPMSLLFMGDASIRLEKELIDSQIDLTADIIKIGHHGSSTSTSPQLLDKVKPKVAMIGVKNNNIYKHPSDEVIERLNRKGIVVLRTDIHGMFHIRYYDNKKYYIYE